MKWAVLATWKMSEEGNRICSSMLSQGKNLHEALMEGVSNVEDNPNFHSVGYGGRPNKECRIFTDGGFMDGDTLHFGAVGSIEGFRSAVRIAHSLIEGDANNFLVGEGAERYAREHGFEERDNVTEESRRIYEAEKDRLQKLEAYDGHDTVCFLAKNEEGSICAATSTSGLFMKEPGRVGDSPVPGSGYYADSKVGAAAATGMGEEIMKGACSFAAVLYMKQGKTAQEAADLAVDDLCRELAERNGYAQPISLIVMDKNGNYGVGTNIDFTFTYGSDTHPVCIYIAKKVGKTTVITPYMEGEKA